MDTGFKAVKISERVYWVGAIDWALRDFHGYKTPYGSTYNAYLVLADKVTLIDTVKAPFYEEMMGRIASIVDPGDISYVISNHAEMDHSGALPSLIDAARPELIASSPMGAAALEAQFHREWDIKTFKTGEELSLGNATIGFVQTPMLHWPDSMFSFLKEEGVLFSSDAFGMHLASTARFADELDAGLLYREAAKYYANILLHLCPVVKKLLGELPSLNLDIKLIAPDHGPIWRKDLDRVIGYYRNWAEQKPTDKAVVVYDTMWGSTARMATAICDGLFTGGARVDLMSLSSSHRSDVLSSLLEAGALLIASPTMNNQIYPSVADLLTYIKGLKVKNLKGLSFGSYGLSGEAVKHIDRAMEDMGIELFREGFRVKFAPSEVDLAACHELGREFATELCDSTVGD